MNYPADLDSHELPEVTVCPDGFQISWNRNRPVHVAWNQIVEIVAYKRDLLTVDMICLGFRIAKDTDHVIEVWEDDSGYDLLVEAVQRRFSVTKNWWREVAFPAFESKWMTIWSRTCSHS